MNFTLKKSIEILEQTPLLLSTQLVSISDFWLYNNEGGNSWSPYDIIGHLIHGEKTDWMVRVKNIINPDFTDTFKPFDRYAQLNEVEVKPLKTLLDTFKEIRQHNLDELTSLNISENDLNLEGLHPEFGKVTLQQLISTWVVHDLGHIAQISRVMASQYKHDVGPWKTYLPILSK